MATGQISRRRRLVAADIAGENAEVHRESEGDEASAFVEEEVFGLTLRLKSYCGMFGVSNKSSNYKSDVLGRTTSNEVVINWCKGSSSSST
ncbi:Receptor-like protein kinase THESEUS 1 [Senna tora]|uniref:Receptor-like protein kinase THESEUS 1 n=1 Tax=Senna tora TaxID=362788 RepID=A0A835CHM6_9FABA|nr:Receptor-like protein kinase THESEUS 1 [Senna tora]